MSDINRGNVVDSSAAGFWANKNAMLAILLVSMCPFQYGLDFGLIGGIQAMVGFLKVRPGQPISKHPSHNYSLRSSDTRPLEHLWAGTSPPRDSS
jgi:hypothetical protein